VAPGRKPVVLIAGGRNSARGKGGNPLGLAGGGKPCVAYVGAASGDNSVFRTIIARMLRRAGAGEVKLAPLCGSRADPGKARRVLIDSDIVFISGGDVEEGMRVLKRTGMVGFLTELYGKGKPFFGASAGSIMLARKWVRWRDPKDDSSAELFNCLGFARVFCDTHGEADGWEELRALQGLAPEGSVSYGICSGSAILVRPDGSVSAMGGEVHRFTRKGRRILQIESLFPEENRAPQALG
jgi:hypothetical protein